MDISCSPLCPSLACKTSAELISVVFLFSSCSVSRDPFVQCGGQAVSCRQWPVREYKLMCYPNTSPSYYSSPYFLSKFVSLGFFASRNSSVGIAVLFVHATSTQHKVFKMHDNQACIMSSPIHHPGVRPSVSSLNRIIHGQGVLFNRATVPTAISPETLHKCN